jgi:hypothetical protein
LQSFSSSAAHPPNHFAGEPGNFFVNLIKKKMAAPPALYFAGEPGYLKSEVFFLYYAILLQETLKLASVFVLLYY